MLFVVFLAETSPPSHLLRDRLLRNLGHRLPISIPLCVSHSLSTRAKNLEQNENRQEDEE